MADLETPPPSVDAALRTLIAETGALPRTLQDLIVKLIVQNVEIRGRIVTMEREHRETVERLERKIKDLDDGLGGHLVAHVRAEASRRPTRAQHHDPSFDFDVDEGSGG